MFHAQLLSSKYYYSIGDYEQATEFVKKAKTIAEEEHGQNKDHENYI